MLNTDKEFEEAFNKFGDSIDGVMTDYPEKLNEFIRAQSLKKGKREF